MLNSKDKKSQKFLTDNKIHFLLAKKLDHQPVGKTHDAASAGTEAPVHTVVIRAGGGGDGNGAILHRNGVAAGGSAGADWSHRCFRQRAPPRGKADLETDTGRRGKAGTIARRGVIRAFRSRHHHPAATPAVVRDRDGS